MGNKAGKLSKADLQAMGLSSELEGDACFVRDSSSARVCLEDFDLLSVIGKGSFGKVFQVRKKNEPFAGKIFAMKTIRKAAIIERDQLEHTRAEKAVLQLVDHPLIVSLKFAFQTSDKVYLVVDYVPGGELFHHLKNQGRFSETRARLYAAEILLGIECLHKLDIIYRDLKPENVLIDANGHAMLTDFGLCKADITSDDKAKTFCGTPEYLAPEIILAKGHGKPVDWWSFGTLVFEMLTGLPPFYDENHDAMYKKILNAPLQFPPSVSPHAADLLRRLLERSPERRPTPDQIKEHPWFQTIDWQAVVEKRTKPEFKPKLSGSSDTRNFDEEFTGEAAVDSVANTTLSESKQEGFKGFSFTPDHL